MPKLIVTPDRKIGVYNRRLVTDADGAPCCCDTGVYFRASECCYPRAAWFRTGVTQCVPQTVGRVFLNTLDGKCYTIVLAELKSREFVEANYPGEPIYETAGDGTCMDGCADSRCPDCPCCSEPIAGCDPGVIGTCTCVLGKPCSYNAAARCCDCGVEWEYEYTGSAEYIDYCIGGAPAYDWSMYSDERTTVTGKTRFRMSQDCLVNVLSHQGTATYSRTFGPCCTSGCAPQFETHTPAVVEPCGVDLETLSRAEYGSFFGLTYNCPIQRPLGERARCQCSNVYVDGGGTIFEQTTSGSGTCYAGSGETLLIVRNQFRPDVPWSYIHAKFQFTTRIIEPCGFGQIPPGDNVTPGVIVPMSGGPFAPPPFIERPPTTWPGTAMMSRRTMQVARATVDGTGSLL